MITRAKYVLTLLLVLFFSVPLAGAQSAPDQGRAAFSQQQLDQMLAPIALYPDSLLSQILMASTYPREVAEAARWSRSNPGLNGDRAVQAVEEADWDPSVKSLVAFPQILDMMDEKMSWTEDLGDAFLDQEAQLMDTVQYLRGKAYSAGNLSSSDQYRVDVEDSTFTIRFSNPEVVYLPYYNPTIVFGAWWWPAYQPVYWAPWPGYRSRPGFRGYAWGPAIPVSRGFFFGAPDWRNRRINVVNVNNYYYRPAHNRPAEVARNNNGGAHVWQHDTAHRRDAPYRNASSWDAGNRPGGAGEARRDPRERDGSPGFGRGAERNATAPAAPAQAEVRSPANQPRPATADNAARGNDSRGPSGRGRDRPFEGHGANANAGATVNTPAPAVTAQPAPRNVPAQPSAADNTPRSNAGRGQSSAREHDRPSFEGRGDAQRSDTGRRQDPGNRADTRAERGNRQAQRENPQPVVAPVARPAPAVAREAAPRSAPVPASVQAAAPPPAPEQRAAVVNSGNRAEAHGGRERDRGNNAAPERGDGDNRRRP